MSACSPGQPVLSLRCQAVCIPWAAVSNPVNWNGAALSAPVPVASRGQGLLHNPPLPGDMVLSPPQRGWGTRAFPAPAPRSAHGTESVWRGKMPRAGCFLGPSSSSLQSCAHGGGDKSAPCHPGQQHPKRISPQARGDQGVQGDPPCMPVWYSWSGLCFRTSFPCDAQPARRKHTLQTRSRSALPQSQTSGGAGGTPSKASAPACWVTGLSWGRPKPGKVPQRDTSE